MAKRVRGDACEPGILHHLYRTEILSALDPRVVAEELTAMAGGRVPVMLCYEKPDGHQWCHRALAARWLCEARNVSLPEFGFEHLPQDQHPLMPEALRRPTIKPPEVES